jgi:hypothetical protein
VLGRRFKGDHIYTVCSDVLISINPYKRIPLLYDLDKTTATPLNEQGHREHDEGTAMQKPRTHYITCPLPLAYAPTPDFVPIPGNATWRTSLKSSSRKRRADTDA